MTHIRLAAASKDVLTGALHTAWKLRVEKNGKSGRKIGYRTQVTGDSRRKTNHKRNSKTRKRPR
jgi:hypothetical protein